MNNTPIEKDISEYTLIDFIVGYTVIVLFFALPLFVVFICVLWGFLFGFLEILGLQLPAQLL
jgi:hypothetical protein